MADIESDAKQAESRVMSLAAAMERIRNAAADRTDVVVEMRQASRTRLELLAQDLKPVIEAVPPQHDFIEHALTSGDNPRLWIDALAFVRMGRDRRTYEFVKDSRLGRIVLGSSESRELTGNLVAQYIAERILEREQQIEGDWVSLKAAQPDKAGEAAQLAAVTDQPAQKRSGWGKLLWFVLGGLVGAAGMVAWAWFGQLPNFLG